MTILSVFQDAATVIAMTVPDLVYGSTEREDVEIGTLANTMAKRIARAHEWELFKATATYTGDGATTAFDLPSDYDRMPKKANIWSASMSAPFKHISDADRWLEYDVTSLGFVINAWTKIGGQIQIKPALASAVTAKHYYQSNLIVAPSSGSNKVAFTADNDTFRLDEELLKLGIIWQWKANKGTPYAEDMANYEELLAQRITEDKGSRKVHVGRPTFARDVDVAYPWSVGV